MKEKTRVVRKRPGGRSARVRSAVLMAALDELAERGYKRFSCEAVAERAGVNKTTVYRRWGTRERLMLDAMVEGAKVGVPVPDTGSLPDDLAVYATTLAAVVSTPAVEAMARAVAAGGDHDAAFAEASRAFWTSHIEQASSIVERGVVRGDLPPGTDPRVVIETLVAPIYFRLLVSGEEMDAGVIRRVAKVVAAGAHESKKEDRSRSRKRKGGGRNTARGS